MDDKLYYVESPDGQVLGPMNMILIIEGIAEGAILDTARICEVGAQEWVLLSDVAYTHEEGPAEAPVAEAADVTPDLDLTPDFEMADAVADAPAEEAHVEEIPVHEVSAGTDGPNENGTDEYEISSSEPSAEEIEELAAPEEPWAGAPAGQIADEDKVSAAEQDPTVYDLPMPIASEEPVAEQPAAYDADTGEFEAPVGSEEDVPFETEAAAEDEWAHVEEEEAEMAVAGGGRPKWLFPAVGGLAVAASFGIYMMMSGGSSAPEVATPEPAAPQVSPMEEATRLLADGHADQALAGFLRVVAEEPENAAAHRGLGRAALAQGDHDTAIQHLEKAWDLKNDDSLWLTDLAQALHESGRTESAIEKVGVYLDEVPGDLEWQQARLDWLLEAGKNKKAARTYAALADANPQGAGEQYLAGVALGEGKKAETYLRKSIELDPANGDAHVALARVLAVDGEIDAAKTSLGKAFEQRPASPEEQAFLASLEKAKPAGKVKTQPKATPPAATQVASAPKEKAPEPKKTEPARAAPAKAAPPAKSETQVAKAEAATPKPAAKAQPQRDDLAKRANLVREALAGEQFDKASSILAKATKELGAGAEAKRNITLWEGIVAFESGDFDAALARFEGLDPRASYKATGWGAGAVPNWIARAYFAKGDVRKAVAALDGVGPTDPNEYATARLWEGLALASLGMTDLAQRTWERIPVDVGTKVGKPGRAAVKSAELLLGSISEKDYRTAVKPIAGYENDMHFFLAYSAYQNHDAAAKQQHLELSMQSSSGREFPYYIAMTEMNGGAILK